MENLAVTWHLSMWQTHPPFLEFYQNECVKAGLFRFFFS